MTTLVSVSNLHPREEDRGALIELLARVATLIQAQSGCTHYSIHTPGEGESGPLTVIQAYSSIEAFQQHADLMRPHLPELAALLSVPPSPPMLLEPVPLTGHRKESFDADAGIDLPRQPPASLR